MKILVVCPKFYPSFVSGGVVRVAYDMCKLLVKRGHDVTVYTSNALDKASCIKDTNCIVDVDGIKVHYFKSLFWKQAWQLKLFITPGLVKEVKKEIQSF